MLEWATTNHPEYSLTICTDSQSLLKAIERRSPVTHRLRSLLNARPGPRSLLWIQGQKRNPRQRARRHRSQSSRFNHQRPPRPIFYASTRSLIHRALIDPPPTNSRTTEVYGGFSWSKDCMTTSNRAVAVLFARLRAGHTPLLKAYGNLLDPSADPLCPLRRSNIGYGGAPGSMQLGRTYFEVLLHPSRSLQPTLKRCWRSQGSPSLALKPQQQQQNKQIHSIGSNPSHRPNDRVKCGSKV